jgi:hypothetical protein
MLFSRHHGVYFVGAVAVVAVVGVAVGVLGGETTEKPPTDTAVLVIILKPTLVATPAMAVYLLVGIIPNIEAIPPKILNQNVLDFKIDFTI